LRPCDATKFDDYVPRAKIANKKTPRKLSNSRPKFTSFPRAPKVIGTKPVFSQKSAEKVSEGPFAVNPLNGREPVTERRGSELDTTVAPLPVFKLVQETEESAFVVRDQPTEFEPELELEVPIVFKEQEEPPKNAKNPFLRTKTTQTPVQSEPEAEHEVPIVFKEQEEPQKVVLNPFLRAEPTQTPVQTKPEAEDPPARVKSFLRDNPSFKLNLRKKRPESSKPFLTRKDQRGRKFVVVRRLRKQRPRISSSGTVEQLAVKTVPDSVTVSRRIVVSESPQFLPSISGEIVNEVEDDKPIPFPQKPVPVIERPIPILQQQQQPRVVQPRPVTAQRPPLRSGKSINVPGATLVRFSSKAVNYEYGNGK
jgi:hypothetical protein